MSSLGLFLFVKVMLLNCYKLLSRQHRKLNTEENAEEISAQIGRSSQVTFKGSKLYKNIDTGAARHLSLFIIGKNTFSGAAVHELSCTAGASKVFGIVSVRSTKCLFLNGCNMLQICSEVVVQLRFLMLFL